MNVLWTCPTTCTSVQLLLLRQTGRRTHAKKSAQQCMASNEFKASFLLMSHSITLIDSSIDGLITGKCITKKALKTLINWDLGPRPFGSPYIPYKVSCIIVQLYCYIVIFVWYKLMPTGNTRNLASLLIYFLNSLNDMHKFKLNYFPRGFNNTYQLWFFRALPPKIEQFMNSPNEELNKVLFILTIYTNEMSIETLTLFLSIMPCPHIWSFFFSNNITLFLE